LEGADLEGADLSFSILDEVNLKYANMTKVLLQEATLCDAICEEANFSSAELAMTLIDRTNFRGAIFDKISIVESLCNETIWPNGKVITDPTF
jgi:uncharacterized protein YjbI with pentapeptide repeats